MSLEPHFDIAIVGAGIAGASLAWRLAQATAGTKRVLLLEAEEQPAYHSTGRSAAMFMESYGPPQARALTRASRSFYSAPPAGFAEVPLMAPPRGALYVGWQGQLALLDAMQAELQATGTVVQRLDAAQTLERVPVLRAEGLLGGVFEADAADLDVHALHQGFLRGARAGGAQLWTAARLRQARRDAADASWQLLLADGRSARCSVLVNAAGAWADAVAQSVGAAPVGLQPKRRSAFTFAAPVGLDPARCPLVAGVDEGWYFKPDAGQMLGSPANADDVLPQDVQPEELDIATGIYNIESATTLQIRRPHSAWAGLRSFVPDGELVIGFDPACAGLFWLAGQGGYGIQSAAAASELAAALLLGQPISGNLEREGVAPARMSPARFRR